MRREVKTVMKKKSIWRSVLQLFKVNRLCGISITANDKQDMASKKTSYTTFAITSICLRICDPFGL